MAFFATKSIAGSGSTFTPATSTPLSSSPPARPRGVPDQVVGFCGSPVNAIPILRSRAAAPGRATSCSVTFGLTMYHSYCKKARVGAKTTGRNLQACAGSAV
jgi:hypothetical protein